MAIILSKNLSPALVPGHPPTLMVPTKGSWYVKKPAKGLLIHDITPTKEIAHINTMNVDVRINITCGDLLRLFILTMFQIRLVLTINLDWLSKLSVTTEKSIYLIETPNIS